MTSRFVYSEDDAAAVFGSLLTEGKRSARSNPNHAPAGSPEGGQFVSGSGGGSGGGVKAKAAKTVADVKAFLDGKSAKDVIVAVATSHAAKETVSFLLQSLVSHGTPILHHVTGGLIPNAFPQGLDASTWHLNEQVIGHTIEHLADTAAITKLQAKDVLAKAVSGLIKMRENQFAAKATRAADDGADDGADEDMALSFLKALRDALEKYQPPAEPDEEPSK